MPCSAPSPSRPCPAMPRHALPRHALSCLTNQSSLLLCLQIAPACPTSGRALLQMLTVLYLLPQRVYPDGYHAAASRLQWMPDSLLVHAHCSILVHSSPLSSQVLLRRDQAVQSCRLHDLSVRVTLHEHASSVAILLCLLLYEGLTRRCREGKTTVSMLHK